MPTKKLYQADPYLRECQATLICTENGRVELDQTCFYAEAGHIEEAYKYVDMRGKHHNPSFPSGFPALKQAMSENHAQFPNKQIIVKNVIGDGDLVMVHSYTVIAPGTPGVAAVYGLEEAKI